MGQSVLVLAEPWDVLVVQEHAQDLDRPDGRGQDVRRLGALEEGLHPAAVLRRTGTAATGADRKGPARLGGQDLFHPQVKAPPGGEVVVIGPVNKGHAYFGVVRAGLLAGRSSSSHRGSRVW